MTVATATDRVHIEAVLKHNHMDHFSKDPYLLGGRNWKRTSGYLYSGSKVYADEHC